MKGSNDVIPVHLRLLAANADLLRETYAKGAMTPAPDQQRAATALLQANALVETADGAYRISRHLKRHLDTVLRRNRSYAVGDDLRAQIDALDKLAASISRAAMAGDALTRDEYGEEFVDAVFEISQDIDTTFARLRVLVDSNFADVASHEEKRAQNQHYLDRLDRVEDTMALIAEAEVQTKLESTPLLDEQRRIYARDLCGRLPEWRAAFLEIASTMREHLHRLRRVEPKARMLRRLGFHLERDRSWTMSDTPEDAGAIPAWASRAAALAFTPSPDVGDALLARHLETVAASMPPATDRTLRTRTRGSLAPDAFESAEISLPVPAWRLSIDEMIARAAVSPLEADAWRQQHAATMPRDLWLFATLDLVDESVPHVVATPLLEESDSRSGTLWLRDVELCPRT